MTPCSLNLFQTFFNLLIAGRLGEDISRLWFFVPCLSFGSLGNMEASPQFPGDVNGDVFRRMVSGGDDLSKPRTIDFCHIFPERRQALAFADVVDDRELKVCISYYEQRDVWQVTVKRHMVPTYQDVTSLELSLAAKAESLGGKADGWGCMTIKRNDTK